MTEAELKEMKALILTHIEEIQNSFPYLLEETKAVEPSVSLGRLTRMEALSEKGVNEYVLAQKRKDLEKLMNALNRIEKGNYGTCIRCGGEIPLGRLKAVPGALVCIPCSEKKK